MTDSLAVLALDAADYDLVRRWGCDNLLLEESGPLETFAYSLDHPFTPEVWTTVATGQHPEEHGVTGDAQEWENPALRIGSKVTQHCPPALRQVLGRPFRKRGADQSFDRTTYDHPFDEVFCWPGITPAHHLDQAWSWCDLAEAGDMTDAELQANIHENTGKEFGWLAAHDGLVGAHSHILDVAGHVYCRRPERLRAVYEWADQQVGWLRGAVDELVLLSDHGMQTTATDDDDPGTHSWRALVAMTDGVQGPLPGSVYDVAEWLESQPTEQQSEANRGAVEMDTPREQLADLGYLES